MAAAIVCGALWGLLWGAGKYLLLWRPLFRPGCSQSRVGIATTVSLLLDALVLFIPFILRSRLPFPWIPTLIATAVTLSLSGILPLLWRAWQQQKQEGDAGGP